MFKNLLAKKSVAQIQSEANAGTLKRTLGKWNLVSLGIGCIIGAGIFVMTGTAAANHAGPALVMSFIFTGIACAFVGLCYAELASVLPISGSAYTYAYATLGEVLAWIMGWLLVLEYGVAASTVAVGWSGYINSFLLSFGVVIPPELTVATGQPVMVTDVYHPMFEAMGYAFNEKGQLLLSAGGDLVRGLFNLPATIGIAMVTALLIVGVSESAKVNNFIVFVKVAVVVLFVAIGIFYVDPANWHPFIPENTGPGEYGWDGIFRAASIIFFAYVGFEAVSTAAQEAKDPQKDMPFGILGSLLVCTLLYIGVSAVMTGIVPFKQLAVADPMAVAVDKIGLGWFAFLIKVGAIMGLSSVMMVLIYGQTRIFYVMSRDGLMPGAFARVHKKFQTPHINTMIVGVVVAIAAGVTPITLLGDLVSLGTLMAFIIVCFSVLYLRKTQPNLPRPFRTPGAPITPLLGMATCGYLVFSIFFGTDKSGSIVLTESGAHVLSLTGPYMLVGAVIYLVYGAHKSKLRNGEVPRTGNAGFIAEDHEKRTD
ncbi:MAG: amino acid permease [Azospirillum brasilense]|nr:MAG: amino acid permease [Azospirillum brasilense]